MLILLLGCAPAPESLVPTDGMHAWSDPALAGCTVTLTTTWNGNGSVDTWRDTFDADGRRASAAEDGDSDGADDAVWTHTWTGESVDTEGSSLVASVTYTDTEHREFEDGKIVRWEVDSFWQESDMATTMTGAVLTTWDGNLPTREEMHSEPEAVTLNQTTTWE